jgi:hypothetical protein
VAAQKVKVVHNEVDPEPIEIIAQSIIDIDAAMKAINNTRLSRRAVVLLIKDQTNLSIGDINRVLTAIGELKKYYIKA